MRVLFLAFEFPPLLSGGVHRAVNLAQLLPKRGVELHVITARSEDYPAWSSASLDTQLLERIPPQVTVHRVPYGFPSWYWKAIKNPVSDYLLRWIFLGDPLSFFWRKPLLETLDRLTTEKKFDVLLATAPPFGIASLARTVARRYKLPWVMDWRDPWSLWLSNPFTSYLHYQAVRAAENRCFEEACFSVATSPVTRQHWTHYFPKADAEKMKVVYNGFDSDDLKRALENLKPTSSEKTRIVHAGSFYYQPKPAKKKWPHQFLHYTPRHEDWLYRSPYFFLKGLRHLLDQKPFYAQQLEIIFAGQTPNWLMQMISDFKLGETVRLIGPLHHHEAIALEKGADALLLTGAKVPGGDYSIAGKTFEYFGLQKRILAVVTDGAMKDLVVQSGLGSIASPDDSQAVADAIEYQIKNKNKILVLTQTQQEFIASMSADAMADKMADLLCRAARQEGVRA